MIDVQELLAKMDGLSILTSYLPGAEQPNSEGWAKINCPFHADTVASGALNVDTKRFKCFACNHSGDVIDVIAILTDKTRVAVMELFRRQLDVQPAKGVSSAIVEEYHAALKMNAELQAELFKRKGITKESISRFRLGWNHRGKRLTIPVRDKTGEYVNIRQYDLLKLHDPKSKMTNIKGHGDLELFPWEQLENPAVIITEGELKAIHLH